MTVPSDPVPTIEAAPAASRPLLKQALAAYGVVPSLLAVMAATQGVDPAVLEAIRSSGSLADPRLEALRSFTQAVVSSRGWPPQDVLDGFLAAGYGEVQLLEVVLGIAFKTLSNYANHMTGTPLDPMFEATRWSAGDGVADD
ncbi:MAG: carboxymuconolactone decarboxylase family protein [Cyanobium sp. PLM2.Bin73]|nr:MAG: carboxymuconolactone decarboxylase family protein [Cyanobium sp. PLM2.Bin73]